MPFHVGIQKYLHTVIGLIQLISFTLAEVSPVLTRWKAPVLFSIQQPTTTKQMNKQTKAPRVSQTTCKKRYWPWQTVFINFTSFFIPWLCGPLRTFTLFIKIFPVSFLLASTTKSLNIYCCLTWHCSHDHLQTRGPHLAPTLWLL